MARFQIRSDARKWFKEIADFEHFNTDFDQYYLCLMAGFASNRSNETGSTNELVENFPEDYKEASRFLIGLLVVAELRSAGIDLTEKEAVRERFRDLIDPASSNQLTNTGMRRLNAYASGGFDFLTEERETKPFSGEEFIRDYAQLIEKAFANVLKKSL